MFDKISRYYTIETASLEATDGNGDIREIRYIKRRFIPSTVNNVVLLQHTVVEGDRLDNVTARYLGDPLQFWRICDANLTMNPPELTVEAGAVISVSLPQVS